MSSILDLDQFRREGYVILDVLTPGECAAHLAAADAIMAQERFADEKRFHYICFFLPGTADAKLQELFQHPVLTNAAQTVLGGSLVLDNASLLAADPGVSYRQGWHRDVLQIPQELITDEMFSPRWKHNNVQLNLALTEDTAFWAVPGSHQRPNSPEEARVFGGSKHQSPVEVSMPGSRCMRLQPGQAVIYHNNMIHRGYCDFTIRRRMIHIGYHSALRPPTWHFYNFRNESFPPEYLATLTPSTRGWIEARIERQKAYPDVQASYRSGFL